MKCVHITSSLGSKWKSLNHYTCHCNTNLNCVGLYQDTQCNNIKFEYPVLLHISCLMLCVDSYSQRLICLIKALILFMQV